MKKILLIVGSLRKGSFNRTLAELAYHDLEGKADVKFLDFKDLPQLNADEHYPFPPLAQKLREEVSQADGLWFFNPEYNGSYTGPMKNLVDTLSMSWKQNDFASGTPLRNKACCISGIAGKMKGMGSREALIKLLKRLQMKVMEEPMAQFALPMESFSTGKWVPTEEEKEAVAKEAEAFLKFVNEHTA